MRVLFLGGTGIISTACTQFAMQQGIDVTLLTRGRRHTALPPGVTVLHADLHDLSAATRALADSSFDAVVDWIAFTPADIDRDLQLFSGRTRQFLFISSASAYQRPATHYFITESTPLANAYWEYSRNKIACEERLMRAYRESGFPVTIIRPSLTYGDTQIPLVLNSWEKPYTIIDRMRKGKKIVVPGDGSSLWGITHNSDFAKGFLGLLGHTQAIGHAFHITSDEVMTWDQYYRIVATAVGVEPHIVHIPSDFIIACLPDLQGTLIGDKSVSVVFDNSKIKRFVPNYCATTPFAQGIRRTLAWFEANPSRQQIDANWSATLDRLIEAYENATTSAIAYFHTSPA
jgi:nucleoside-diphosphate-sugar epimerase